VTDHRTTGDLKPWGRFATLGLAIIALMVGQFAGLTALSWFYRLGFGQLPDFGGDGVAVTLIIAASTPVEVLLLVLFAQRTGARAADYLGWVWPRRSHVVFGVAAIAALIIVGDAISWLFGRGIVTDFQTDIYRTASAAGWLPLLFLAVVVVTPIGEETLFRGFLFRGWLKSPHDAWPVIGATALLFALMHVQYDWFIMLQVFISGLLLGWMRWATGSTILTVLLHSLINIEGMLETFVSLHH
jgi:membrane protease YdiL (CAAX protease family)